MVEAIARDRQLRAIKDSLTVGRADLFESFKKANDEIFAPLDEGLTHITEKWKRADEAMKSTTGKLFYILKRINGRDPTRVEVDLVLGKLAKLDPADLDEKTLLEIGKLP